MLIILNNPFFRHSWQSAKAHIDTLDSFLKKHKKIRVHIRSSQGQRDLKKEITLFNNLNEHITYSIIDDIEDWNKRRRLTDASAPTALNKELEELKDHWGYIMKILAKRKLIGISVRIPISDYFCP